MHIFGCFQGIGQPEQIVLFSQLAGAGTPEVIQLAGQLRADVPVSEAGVVRRNPPKFCASYFWCP
ncbi:hypothetical protein JKI69_003679 [Salmonella enterica]|nr:hypothetical protein [Salmonella enterica]